MRAVVGSLGLLVLAATATAHADPDPTLRAFTTTRPLAGEPGCPAAEDACEGASRQFAGSMVLARAPRPFHAFELVATGWGMSLRDDGLDVSQGIGALGLRGWLGPLWLQGALGGASAEVSHEATALAAMSSTLAPAAMLGAGVQLLDAPHLALDLSLHGGTAVADGELRVYHVSVGLGARWR